MFMMEAGGSIHCRLVPLLLKNCRTADEGKAPLETIKSNSPAQAVLMLTVISLSPYPHLKLMQLCLKTKEQETNKQTN